MSRGDPTGERWLDEEAGPLVRPYAVARGRARPRGEPLDIVTILIASGRPVPPQVRLNREQQWLLVRCRRPVTVADLASEANLPLGVVMVLLEELLEHGLIEVTRPLTSSAQPDPLLLRRVIDELRAL
ncbi:MULTISPECIES: DUF742 domain-containing protein [Thermomonospora]|uniref:DUF742 domain-containing protein n=1 Tax=Thermomonospora curvata (strain ATCC 19995 / DSM 43183 / JCM 3096 / KCTC 9072 / NBRC 15933 / NCIMB 10081 / Henssen B9) TaxID=471852 RepID=D1AAG4_THECD|nr:MULTISPECIES: DUF742 domain-containing protein [Thermomonospora]ACY98877.1 protein of unknown function DUF742 [Thermomonospora curvata DSM 43183]PKK13082.1 MAG: DUF742 domain-containing protein [Thermomonospora sp. CIF 1]